MEQNPPDIEQMPSDPESLCGIMASEPSAISYWQTMAEDLRHKREMLELQRTHTEAAAYIESQQKPSADPTTLVRSQPAEQRKRVALLHPKVVELDMMILEVDHQYRSMLLKAENCSSRFAAARKIVTWRIAEIEVLGREHAPTTSFSPQQIQTLKKRATQLSYKRSHATEENVEPKED